MSKTINPYWKRRLFWVGLALAALLIWLSSCSEAKKGQQAVKRVTANVDLLNQVGEVYRQLKPCASDTTLIEIHDSTTVTNIKYVTKTDTVTKDGIKYIFRLDTAYFEKTRWQVQTKIIVDREKENRLTDTINSLRLREAAFTGTKLQLEKNIITENKRGDKWKLYFYIACALLGLSAFFNVKSLLAKIPKIKL